MLSQYEPNVKATITFLRLLKVSVNKATVNETLQNHPDWPTLLCISDSLNKWKIPNGAAKINATDIDQLPLPFIAYTPGRQGDLSVVTKVIENRISYYAGNYNKLIEENKSDFLKKWNGIYLIAEPNEISGEKDYAKHRKQFFATSVIPMVLATISIAFSFFLFQSTVNYYTFTSGNTTAGCYLQYFIQLTGVIVTLLLLCYEIDKNNPILQKVCSGFVKGNCGKVLTSKGAKIFQWLSWSEVGFFYFSGGLLLLSGGNFFTSIAIVSGLNILALPYPIFSIYYQWKVAKQWCVLCLAIQFLLMLGAANIFINLPLSLPALSSDDIVKALLFYLLPFLCWFTIKPFIQRLQQAKNAKREYLRIKFNTEIFELLLKKQKPVNVHEDLGINLGNCDATNTIVKVCNPYCGPCAKVHPKLEELLEKNNNLKVKIIFNVTKEETDVRSLPVKHILAINEQKIERLTKQALDDWYLSERKDYNSFAKKYPMNGELQLQENKIEAMDKWCKETGIEFTPTFFVNGYQLPNAYSIEDLEYFLAQ